MPARQSLQRLLNGRFAAHIKRGGRLIENQHRGIFQEGARDGHALLLPAGEPAAALGQHELEALGLLADNPVHASLVRRRLNLGIRRAAAAHTDVLADRRAEE